MVNRQKGARFYFSLRSPYAWLAWKKLEAAGFELGSDLRYLPFFEPDGRIATKLHDAGGRLLYRPMSAEKHLYILQDIQRLCEADNIKPKFPRDVAPDWSIPHRVFAACGTSALKNTLAKTLMDERWLEGANIWCWKHCQTALSKATGAEEARSILESARSQTVEDKLVENLLEAYRDGVFGVPFGIVGRQKFWGSDRMDQFLTALAVNKGE